METKPHILVFFTDDHGQWAGSPYGNREVHCPTMQWLADTGAVMANACTPCPVCSPARASFWTGKIPSAHGVHDYLHETPDRAEHSQHPGIVDQLNLGQLLQQRGYRTAMVGKWHAGGGGTPVVGFDDWFSSLHGTNARFGEQCFSDNGREVRRHGHQSPMLAERAIAFLRASQAEHPDQPVFLFVGLTDTHSPHDNAPQRLTNGYAGATFADIPDETFAEAHGRARFPENVKEPACRGKLVDYYASVEMIDQQMGAVLDAWASLGQLDDTLVIYTADHGHFNGHHGLTQKGNASWPQNFLEEAILVPSLWRWPGQIEPGRRHAQPMDHCDLFSTILDAAGRSTADAIEADGVPRPGQSVLPILQGQSPPWRDWVIGEYANARMIRDQQYKLIRRWPALHYDPQDELYDLGNDPRERINLLDSGTTPPDHLDKTLVEYFDRYARPEADGIEASRIAGRHNEVEPWAYQPE